MGSFEKAMNHGASQNHFLSVRLALACMISTLAASTLGQPLLLRTETFDTDPGWDARNNRSTDPVPGQMVQDFGFSGSSINRKRIRHRRQKRPDNLTE